MPNFSGQFSPVAGSDDAEHNLNTKGGMKLDLASNTVNDGSGAIFVSGIRFPSVTIPPGASIKTADLFMDEGPNADIETQSTRVLIRIASATNPITHTEFNTATYPNNRGYDLQVPPVVGNADTGNVDQLGRVFFAGVANLLQAAVNRTGWASGNAIYLGFFASGAPNLEIPAVESALYEPVRLYATWTTTDPGVFAFAD